MDKKRTSVLQQQFCNAAADVLANQESGEKYLNPICGNCVKEVEFSFAMMLFLHFGISVNDIRIWSRMC